MRRVLLSGVALASLLLIGVGSARAEKLEVVTGKAFDSGFVKDFYLEGNSIPTQKRNAAMLKASSGKRLVFGLLDTSGYGADIQAKYVGMAITEKKLKLGDAALAVGAYGLGLQKPKDGGEQAATLVVYDVAGDRVGEARAVYDAKLSRPVPLQVVNAEGQPTRLYLGRYWVALD